ncbi:hypothetical protein E4U17_002808 [Claviceps sp. LM77 group G4]|nr:hypothetical protein E4U17_002808 [Claviceps sp. LM77 group G4]KAG6057962.1 hypothetical protein E4U33_007382 [Claviceps sp. LM78 group G4]KAG6074695.1 hypothetical protein E4U16_003820 [Claviceps sp. LM84 group G4]
MNSQSPSDIGNQFIHVLYWAGSPFLPFTVDTRPNSSQYSVDSRDLCHGLDYTSSIRPNITGNQHDSSFDQPGHTTDRSVRSGIPAVGSASSEIEDSYFNTWDSPGLEAIARLFRHAPAACPPHLPKQPQLRLGHIHPSISPSVAVGSSVPCLSMPSDNQIALNTSVVTRQSSTSQSSLVGRNILDSPSPEETPLVMTDRKTYQDELLKQGRRQGIAYRDLRVKHRFDVSESTLRGRYRNLTKARSERPREPQWTEQDSELLKEAVPLFTHSTVSGKVSWKGVSNYISSNGGSHAFSFATCRAKFERREGDRKWKNGMKKKKERDKGHSE